MMMAPPQVVGVLLKKPGQNSNPRAPPLDPQETKIRGELYVEDLNKRRIVSIRMGWLWVENTQMRLPLRALNLRQAAPGICQPHVLALGFTLTNSQGDLLATFWADTEPIYWSWVRAIAAELVRQTPFRAQRCLNFLEILTICPRGPLPLPESPTEIRRRSRSELRCWLDTPSLISDSIRDTAAILDNSRRRARSELRGWSSSNSSDEDLHLAAYRSIQKEMLPKIETAIERRLWGCSESSEGSDDSLPWGGCRSSVDSIDSAPSIPEPVDTREQRIQRYKEARRRENEARSRRVLEEDAKRRKARREENNNNNKNNVSHHVSVTTTPRIAEANKTEDKSVDIRIRIPLDRLQSNETIEQKVKNDRNNPKTVGKNETLESSTWTCHRTKRSLTNFQTNGTDDSGKNNGNTTKSSESSLLATITDPFIRAAETVDAITRRLPPLKASLDPIQTIDKFKASSHPPDIKNNNSNVSNNNNINKSPYNNNKETSTRYKVESPPSPTVARTDSGERRSRARERRNVRERCQISLFHQAPSDDSKTTLLQDRKERLSLASRIPSIGEQILRTCSNSRLMEKTSSNIGDRREFACVEKEFRERDAISLSRINTAKTTSTNPAALSIHDINSSSTCEEDVAKLLARCQRVDHYVPVREKLTLFESLSRLGGRLARSTEDLGRSTSKPSPRGKQRARSLHDLNRPARSVPVREMCRFFEGDKTPDTIAGCTSTNPRPNETASISFGQNTNRDSPTSILKNHHHQQDVPPCVRMSSRRKHYQK